MRKRKLQKASEIGFTMAGIAGVIYFLFGMSNLATAILLVGFLLASCEMSYDAIQNVVARKDAKLGLLVVATAAFIAARLMELS